MKQMGFDDVYHLKEGILKYFEEVAQRSLWKASVLSLIHVSVDHSLQKSMSCFVPYASGEAQRDGKPV